MERNRRPDIDWLRVFATYLLFVFHVGKVFDPAPFYHVRNADLSFAFLVVCGFISLWHMPLFFFLAGWSLFSSLQARGTAAFAKERLLRLGVPLLAGCVLLAPFLKFFELRSGLDLSHTGLRVAPALQEGFRQVIPNGLPVAEPFHEGFFTFLPTFFTLERFTWGHLWFVAYLLTLTLLYLPGFAWLAARGDRLKRIGTWVVYLPVFPLAVVQLTMRSRWPGIYNLYNDWANIAFYTVFLVAGFLLAAQPVLEGLVAREWKRSLAIAVAVTLLLLIAVLGVFSAPVILLAGSAIAGWCFVVAFFGFARRSLTAPSPALAYLSESAFPVYILHQVAIVVPGYFIVQWSLGIAAKFGLLLLVAVAVTLSVYHWLVRPFAVPRLLLGMRPKVCPLRRPIRLAPSVAATVAVTCIGVVGSARAATPVGLWYAERGAARVAVEPCGRELCGRVVWLRSPFDDEGCDLRDRNNPEPGLRQRPVVGLEILHGLTPGADGTWTDGRIYDPGSGSTYTCNLALDGDDRLRLRGYVGIPLLGRTTTWTRVGAEKPFCQGSR